MGDLRCAAEEILGTSAVFCISLDGSSRWPQAKAGIRRAGFGSLQRFPAVRGKTLPDEQLAQLLHPRVYATVTRGLPRHSHDELSTYGAVGCYLSHVAIWQRMVHENLDAAVIFEDDVVFAERFARRLRTVWSECPTDADVLLIGHNHLRDRVAPVDRHVQRCLGRFFSAHAYYLTGAGARKLLGQALPIDSQLDAYIGHLALCGRLCVYASAPSLVSQGPSLTRTLQSSVQVNNLMRDIKPYLPTAPTFYWLVALLLIVLVAAVVVLALASYRGQRRPFPATEPTPQRLDAPLLASSLAEVG